LRYTARPNQDAALTAQLVHIREKYPRFGIRRAHALLRADGQIINRKRVERIWRKSGFQVPQRPKKRKIRTGRTVPCQAECPNHVWSYDFQEDALVSGRKLRLLSILDEFTREWLSVTVGVSLTSQAVLAALKPLFALRGVPRFVRSDNGPEFIASEIKAWLLESGSSPHYPNKTSYRSRLPVAEWVSREFSRQGARRAAQSRTLCFCCPSPDTPGSASALVQ